jgi:predicted amidophosphoribosyltransferase
LRLKRQTDPELLAHCAQLLLSRWEAEAGGIQADAVVPVPAHRLRNWIRGRNPALELAREFARRARVPFRQALERKRFICPQSVLSQSLRRRNQTGTFRVARRAEVPEVALLIDDVVTTGATADAAARELKRAGSRAVYLLALTRSV